MGEKQDRLYANHMAGKLCNKDSIGKLYHANSKLTVTITEESIIRATSLVMDPRFSKNIRQSEKAYPGCEVYDLIKPQLNESLNTAIMKRKSHNPDRNAVRRRLGLQDLSSISWAGYGLIDSKNINKTVPSAGALYPCEMYLLSIDTELGEGLFHYSSKRNAYELVRKEKIDVSRLFVSTIGIAKASAIFIVTTVFDRAFFKYGERAYRFILLEAGEITQNISLAAASLGYYATSHGGTADFELESFMGIDGVSESVIIAVGIS